ncbi:helix-turn-helix domain-containing protein [Streptomyces aidingensis]|uniref:Helix-turn-helix domain-containing protein n=1 Tax=Streptomyces aidingensis TaxID=910347 RepID=A0A1I1RRH2_9ACTN|nr:helix-turn-helix transcriptional regulator [Streptomyces aidingensis]SFD34848.1 Helix-turn-helix domain-containing protein [Streptomyces aidingensis]
MTIELDQTAVPEDSVLTFFGEQLAAHRRKAGWTQEQTARAARSTQSMISKVEKARLVPSDVLAADLDRAFGSDRYFTRLHALVRRYAYPRWFLPYIALEQDATAIRSFEGQVLPGLLQTEEYAHAMLAAVRPDNLAELVAVRMSRQEILGKETRPHTWFIIDEFALMRHIGGPQVMRRQLRHLLEAGRHPRTVVQIVPRSVPARPALAGPFTLLTPQEGETVVYIDGYPQGRLSPDTGEVTAAVHAYDLLRAVALSPQQSAELIDTHLRGLS